MTLHTQGTVPCENCNETYGKNHLLTRHNKEIHVPLGDALYNGESGHMTIKSLLPKGWI